MFSDKTGTLTKNEMILQQCSVNGTKYRIMETGLQEFGKLSTLRMHQYDRELLSFFQALSVCHTVQVADVDRPDEAEEMTDESLEATFEIIDSVTAFLDKEDDHIRTAETRSNTLQNEMSAETNLLGDCMPKVAPVQGEQHIFEIFWKTFSSEMHFSSSSSAAQTHRELCQRAQDQLQLGEYRFSSYTDSSRHDSDPTAPRFARSAARNAINARISKASIAAVPTKPDASRVQTHIVFLNQDRPHRACQTRPSAHPVVHSAERAPAQPSAEEFVRSSADAVQPELQQHREHKGILRGAGLQRGLAAGAEGIAAQVPPSQGQPNDRVITTIPPPKNCADFKAIPFSGNWNIKRRVQTRRRWSKVAPKSASSTPARRSRCSTSNCNTNG